LSDLEILSAAIKNADVSDVILLSSFEELFNKSISDVELLLPEDNRTKLCSYLESNGYILDVDFLSKKNTMYGLGKPILFKEGGRRIFINSRLGYSSNVGNFLVPVTRDVEDNIYLHAHKINNRFFYASEEYELLNILCHYVFSGTHLYKNMDSRANELRKKVGQKLFEDTCEGVFFSAAPFITHKFFSSECDLYELKEQFLTFGGY